MSNQADRMSIGTLAKTAGVNVETIRFYERKRLLLKQAHSEIRRYTAEDLRRVKFVKAAKRLGFTLSEIGALMKLEDGKHCNEVSELARVKLHDVREKVAALQNMESALEQLIAGCDANQDDGFCHLISALQAKD
jgi:MerR family transcriptional regulator, mercuric resistance operon regulatory protein